VVVVIVPKLEHIGFCGVIVEACAATGCACAGVGEVAYGDVVEGRGGD
jgi:hypothetical protein